MNKNLLFYRFQAFKAGALLLLLMFFTALVIGKYVGKGYVHVFLLIGFIFVFYVNYKGVMYSKEEERLILFGVFAYLIALLGFFNQHEGLTRFGPALDGYLSALIPLSLLSILYIVKISRYDFLIWAMLLSVWVASIMTIFAVSDSLPRGGGTLHGSPIIFGDLAMLFGILLLIFSSLLLKKKLFFIVLITGILGVTVSLLSGSRGGWIVLVTLPLFLIPVIPKQYRYKVLFMFLTLVFILVASVLFTDNNIKFRILAAYTEFMSTLFVEDYTTGSIGQRITMWKVSLAAFLSSPIFGIGVGEFYAFKQAVISAGEAPAHIVSYKHSHNEYLTILSGMGLVGIIFYLVFFVWLWKLFLKAMSSQIKEVKVMGIAGLSTIVCYLDFSLSESFLSSTLGGGAFYFLMTFFVYFIHRYRAGDTG